MPDSLPIACLGCGASMEPAARFCPGCGRPRAALPLSTPKQPEQGDATGGVIPYKNVPALFAYYLGVFSLIPCFPLGIAALILGIVGLRRVKANPAIRGTVHAWIGIIVGGLFGTVWLVGTVMMLISMGL